MCTTAHPFYTPIHVTISEFFKKIFSRLLLGNCLGLVVATLALVIGTLYFLDAYTLHGQEIEVPDVRGMNEETATRKLEARGFEVEVTDTGYVYNAAPASILEQSLRPGQKVNNGRLIQLTINANNPRQIALPDLANNCSRREAEDRLRVLGFKLGATEYVQGDADWVLDVKVHGRSVAAGTKISVFTPITLVVGAGGIEDEYNGNDSLDFIINAETSTDDDLSGVTDETPSAE